MVLVLTKITLALFFLLILSPLYADQSPKPQSIVVESFCNNQLGAFPEGWKAKDDKGKHIYKVRKEDYYFLEANTKAEAIAIAKEFKYDLKEYPVLSWRWRALKLPSGGDERCKEAADSAAGVYVVFEGRVRRNVVKYVWSSSLPIDTCTESPYDSPVCKTRIIVLENHNSPLGEWVSEERNVYEDYKHLFGEEPNKVKAIGIMSDSDNTNSQAIAHYADIIVKKVPRTCLDP